VNKEQAVELSHRPPDIEGSNVIALKVVFSTTFSVRSRKEGFAFIWLKSGLMKPCQNFLAMFRRYDEIIAVHSDAPFQLIPITATHCLAYSPENERFKLKSVSVTHGRELLIVNYATRIKSPDWRTSLLAGPPPIIRKEEAY
jgi:hypothetical protein